MDLLEYQGKQLFGRHGLAVSDGKAVKTVEDAVAAANEIGYPVVVKAQVLIGGRPGRLLTSRSPSRLTSAPRPFL